MNKFDPGQIDDRAEAARAALRILLEERGASSFKMSEALGRNRTYLDDFLRSKKRSLPPLEAKMLGWVFDIDMAYLMGFRQIETDKHRRKPFDIEDIGSQDAKRLEDLSSEVRSLGFDLAQVRASDPGTGKTTVGTAPGLRGDPAFCVPEILYSIDGYPEPEAIREDGSRVYRSKDLAGLWYIPKSVIEKEISAAWSSIDVVLCRDDSLLDDEGTGISRGDRVIIDRSRVNPRLHRLFVIEYDGKLLVRFVDREGQPAGNFAEVHKLTQKVALGRGDPSPEVRLVGRVVMKLGYDL